MLPPGPPTLVRLRSRGVNSGGNAGTAVGVGDTVGSVGVDGGTVVNATQLGISANGGTGVADASGGNYNLAFVS